MIPREMLVLVKSALKIQLGLALQQVRRGAGKEQVGARQGPGRGQARKAEHR
jgi:hypothetical protein